MVGAGAGTGVVAGGGTDVVVEVERGGTVVPFTGLTQYSLFARRLSQLVSTAGFISRKSSSVIENLSVIVL